MHTPEQAKALWCPMVRVAACNPNGAVANGQTVFNRLQNGKYTALPDSGNCIADRCAMWRWLDQKPPAERTHAAVMALANRRGYCGLAGSPAT